jgi:hypothetical protein
MDQNLDHCAGCAERSAMGAIGASSGILPAVTRMHMALVGAFFGAAFAVSGVVRGDVAPGLVGGALGAVLVFLVLQRVQAHNDELRRRREQARESSARKRPPRRAP